MPEHHSFCFLVSLPSLNIIVPHYKFLPVVEDHDLKKNLFWMYLPIVFNQCIVVFSWKHVNAHDFCCIISITSVLQTKCVLHIQTDMSFLSNNMFRHQYICLKGQNLLASIHQMKCYLQAIALDVPDLIIRNGLLLRNSSLPQNRVAISMVLGKR
jgi:hypothetical protein